MKTTLNKIRDHGPCANGWEKLLRHLDKTKPDDEPLDLLTVLNSNGLEDCLWCFRAVEGHEKEMRLFAVWCAQQVQHLMTDPRSLASIDVAERFANGNATSEELVAARTAAWDAARDAAWTAAWDAAWAAAGAAAWDAARDAAWDAARTAAWDAAWDAARDAAWAAARTAARDAAWAAGDAAGGAAWAKQEERLREILKEGGK